jgi:hypothetical protein
MNQREFEKRRKEQVKALLDSATPEQRKRIKAAREAGRKWCKELEAIEQRKK